jgi:hypothetical protein
MKKILCLELEATLGKRNYMQIVKIPLLSKPFLGGFVAVIPKWNMVIHRMLVNYGSYVDPRSNRKR